MRDYHSNSIFKSIRNKRYKNYPPREIIKRNPMKHFRIEQKRNEEGNYIPSQDESIQELSRLLKEEEKKAEKTAKMDRVLAFIKIRNLMEYGAYCIERERIYKK